VPVFRATRPRGIDTVNAVADRVQEALRSWLA
jgi:hypothetical protein